MSLQNKIDFALVFTVKNANPNGDPLIEGRPRQTVEGLGEVTDVCLKRKLRNRFEDLGEEIFVKQLSRIDDEKYGSLKDILMEDEELYQLFKNKEKKQFIEKANKKWFDVRTFGQVFAFKGEKNSLNGSGTVSIQSAYSLNQIMIEDKQIAKNINSVNGKTKNGKASDTMGWYYSIPFGVYICYGTVFASESDRTGFNEEDLEILKESLVSIFENDASVSRPSGSMDVKNVYWWTHEKKNGNASSAKVHQSLQIEQLVDYPTKFEDYKFTVKEMKGITCEILEGF